LDVRVRTAPDARFETTFAETLEAQADVNLTGTLAQPGMLGRATISQGDMIFFGNEYLVNRGTIAFYNPLAIEPQVNISLQTTVLNINVTLNVTGAMDNLKLSYVSDPPLQFDEIVALLATGKRPSSDPAIVASEAPPPQQSIGEMGASAVVSQAVASPVASRLQRVFGVNQLRIDPTFAGGSALPTARLSLQQRVSNSITFTYSQDLSQANSELIRVEWALNPKFSAVATRDENGIFGVDFFYKLQLR
jgi:translocation and assembly module TamB